MKQRNAGHGVLKDIVHLILVVSICLHIELYLVVEFWNISGTDSEINWSSESSLVNHDFEGIFLEKRKEVLSKSSGNNFLVVLS